MQGRKSKQTAETVQHCLGKATLLMIFAHEEYIEVVLLVLEAKTNL